MVPLALTEFWYGKSPKGEIRHHGMTYEPCQAKCQPILPFLLGNRLQEVIGSRPAPSPVTHLEVLYEDPWLIAVDKPKLEVHFLGIGIRKQQTARLVFTSKTGRGIKATVVDLGNRFRLISQEVECIEPKPMPNLPVASALWVPQPTFEIGAGAWILAGGTHHSAFSYDITEEYWEDFAEMLGIEYVKINKDTKTYEFKQQLQNNEIYYMLNKALR
jgi:L-arabinose isomerase